MIKPVIQPGMKLIHVVLPADDDEDRIRIEKKGGTAKGITKTFPRSMIPGGNKCVCLISLDRSHYHAVGVISKEDAASTFDNRVRISLVNVFLRIAMRDVLSLLSGRSKAKATKRAVAEIADFPANTANDILAAVAEIRPDFFEAWQKTLSSLSPRRMRFNGAKESFK